MTVPKKVFVFACVIFRRRSGLCTLIGLKDDWEQPTMIVRSGRSWTVHDQVPEPMPSLNSDRKCRARFRWYDFAGRTSFRAEWVTGW